MEHETLDRWMRGMTFGRAHFYCTTLILLFTFFNTCVFLRPLDLDPEVYRKKDHGVYVKLYDENYMKFDQVSQRWHSEVHHSVYMKFDHVSVFIQRVKVVLVFMAVMVLMLTMVIILDLLGACCNNLGGRPLKCMQNILLAVISYCPFMLQAVLAYSLEDYDTFTKDLVIPFIVIIVLLTLAHRSTANHFDKKKEEEQDKEGREEKEELLKACLLACC